MKKIIIFIAIFLMLAMPAFSLAEGLVPDCPSTGCGWTEFISLINKVIKFILFKLVVPIAAVMFFYAGFLMVTSGGSTEARGRAKNIFTNAVLGLVIAAGAWLIIKTILSILSPATGGVSPWAWIGF